MKKAEINKYMFISALAGFIFTVTAMPAGAENSALVSKLDEGVVRIISYQEVQQKLEPVGTGSGFVVAGGIVVTNRHVVDDAAKVAVMQKRGDIFDLHDAEVLWSSSEVDLAIIRSKNVRGTPAKISTVVPEKGAKVLAIGFPGKADDISPVQSEASWFRNLAESTITQGIIGRKVTTNLVENGQEIELLQHNAQVNKGNSGGPLFNECGEVIGVNTIKAASEIVMDDDRPRVSPTEGVYWAVTASNLANALRSKNIEFTPIDTECRTALTPDSESGVTTTTEQNFLITLAVIVAVGMSIVAIVLVMNRGHRKGDNGGLSADKRTSASVGQKSQPPKPDSPVKWIFRGRTSDGKPIHLILRKHQFDGRRSVLLGRDERICDLAIEDSSVSRQHARLEYRNGQLFICDLGSRNGTRVNENHIGAQERPLSAPCKLVLGSLILSVTSAVND